MLEFSCSKSYEADFLGRHVLNGAITTDILSQLVQNLPERNHAQVPRQCTVQCNTVGLTVSRTVTNSSGSTGRVVLKVPLCDILFCHVDKQRPEVTVWVVRSDDDDGDDDDVDIKHRKPFVQRRTKPPGERIIQAYIYQCVNRSDALGLFNVYNEMNQQAKLDKYRRNVEKREENVLTTAENTLEPSRVSDMNGGDSGFLKNNCSDVPQLLPCVTVLFPNVKEEVRKINKVAAQVPDNSKTFASKVQHVSDAKETVVPSSAVKSNGYVVNDNNHLTWSSIVGSIGNYRKSFRILRPRDKEVRAAVLEELRERLRSRNGSDIENDHSVANGKKLPEATTKQPDNRQRKPAKTLQSPEAPAATEKLSKSTDSPMLVAPSSASPSKNSFPWSMRNAVKKLVSKKRNNGYMMTSTFRPVPFQPPVWLMHQQVEHQQVLAPSTSSKGKLKSTKKSPAPAPPGRLLNQRLVGNGGDPYFYLPPLPMIHEVGPSAANSVQQQRPPRSGGSEVVVPNTSLRKNQLSNEDHGAISRNGFKKNGTKVLPSSTSGSDINQRSYPMPRYVQGSAYQNGIGGDSNGYLNKKKAAHVAYGLGRFSRASLNKKRTPGSTSTFYRTSSTGSRGSTSSESDPDNKLRSVMKKPRQTTDISPPEQKKNVTFHAFATVQVLN